MQCTVARELFRRVFISLEAHRAASPLQGHPLNEIYAAERDAAAKRFLEERGIKSRSKRPAWQIAAGKGWTGDAEIYQRYQERATQVFAEWEAVRSLLEDRLIELAEEAVLSPLVAPSAEPGEPKAPWLLFYIADDGTYNSQGFGASKYAKGVAENWADQARRYDVPVCIWRKPPRIGKGYRGESFEYGGAWCVFVAVVEPLDLEILKRKPEMSLREWVRAQWKRGVNPRVYNPWLPVGYEEKVGLDYFGGETKKEP